MLFLVGAVARGRHHLTSLKLWGNGSALPLCADGSTGGSVPGSSLAKEATVAVQKAPESIE